jgi:hypothetical protein
MGWPEERRCSRRTEKRVARPWQRLRRRPRLGSRRAPVGRSHPRGRPILNRPARRGSVAVKAVGQSPAQAAADQAFCLRAQELRPAGADPPRRRPQVRAAQHVRDRGRRDADAQPFQLTLDTHVAPPRVLSCQPRDQAACLGGKRWTTEPATRSPIAPQQRPMPAAKRLRADRKTRPALRRKQPTRCGEQRSVCGRVMRPLPSAPEDGQLMAQHDDLKFALAAAADERAKKTAEEPVRQRHQHDRQSDSAAITSTSSHAESNFFTPQDAQVDDEVLERDVRRLAVGVEVPPEGPAVGIAGLGVPLRSSSRGLDFRNSAPCPPYCKGGLSRALRRDFWT